MPRFTLTALLALCLAGPLAGCGPWNRLVEDAVNNRRPGTPPELSDKNDGDYKGRPVLVDSRSPRCEPPSEAIIEVGDGTLYLAYQPDAIFVAPIQPDGTFKATAGLSHLDGFLRNGRLVLTVSTPVCETYYNMRWVL